MSSDSAIGSASNSSSQSASAAATAAQQQAALATLSGSQAASSASSTQAGSQELNSNFSQFLTLLTQQLQNQDPLNPMDSSTFTQQLVEYSQVEQQLSTNTKLDNLTTLSLNTTLSLALGYVGKEITYTSAEANFDGSSPVKISYNLASQATTSILNVTDSEGNIVHTATVSGNSGLNSATWDGKEDDGTTAPTGTYTVTVTATDATGAPLTATTAVNGMVRGVESQDGVPTLLVGDRSVAIGNVIDVSVPASTTTASTNTSTNTNS